ncbi:hypothetical protein MTR67_033574 [Solanum verrucosum]|uniref:Uncharacterized protein n=1 Tax=Solanum verrucosum TaxID=315347 RepID=A0AAF0ZKF8_SOLVR|nr:hypothetical protein MTR67_033574 [Solanum verrucosum]
MQVWYSFGAYLLTPGGKYSFTQSYNTLLGQHIHLFSTCEWIVRVQTEMQQWSGTLIPIGTVKHIL